MDEPLKIVRLGDCSPEERQQLLKRSELDATFVVPTVRVIVEEVKKRGDEALLEYSSSLDKVRLKRRFAKRIKKLTRRSSTP
jgi:histidinol dehydrogenase